MDLIFLYAFQGSVREVNDTKLVVDLYSKVIAERAYEQLSNLPVVVIRDEMILTRRVLESMHRFHKLAITTDSTHSIGIRMVKKKT